MMRTVCIDSTCCFYCLLIPSDNEPPELVDVSDDEGDDDDEDAEHISVSSGSVDVEDPTVSQAAVTKLSLYSHSKPVF